MLFVKRKNKLKDKLDQITNKGIIVNLRINVKCGLSVY